MNTYSCKLNNGRIIEVHAESTSDAMDRIEIEFGFNRGEVKSIRKTYDAKFVEQVLEAA